MKKIRILYIVPRSKTGSDRYYELLAKYIPETKICWLPKIYFFFPPFLLFWRFFSFDFRHSDIIHTNCEHGLYFFSFKKKLVTTFHHDIFSKLNFDSLESYKKLFHTFFTSICIKASMMLSKKIVFVKNHDYMRYSNIPYLKNKCTHI